MTSRLHPSIGENDCNEVLSPAVCAGAEGKLHLEGSVKTTKWKLHWLPNLQELVPLRLVDFDHLITKRKLEDTDAIEDFVNMRSV